MCPDRKRKWYQRLSLNPSSARARVRAKITGRGDETGLSLVEVMVAFTVLMIALVPLAYLLNATAGSAAQNREKQAAIQLANSWVQILSNTTPPVRDDGIQDGVEQRAPLTGKLLYPYPAFASMNPSDMVTTPPWPAAGTITPSALLPQSTLSSVSSQNCPTAYNPQDDPGSGSYVAGNPKCPTSMYYTVTAYYSFAPINSATQSDYCQAGQPSAGDPDVIDLQVTASWGNGDSTHQVTATTNIPYPSPNVQTEGFLAVQLVNDGLTATNGLTSAQRYPLVTITVTGPVTTVLNADSNGCAFAQLPPGTYDVNIGQPSGGSSPPYVTEAGATSIDYPTVVVNEAAVTDVDTIAFDQAINANLAYPSPTDVAGGVTCPGGNGITCIATGSNPSGLSASTGGAGATWSTNSVSGMSTISQVTCTSGGGSTCVAVGSGSGGGAIETTSSDLTSATNDPVPAGVTNITQIACPSTNGCYALGMAGSTPVILAGAVGQTDTWSIVTVPNTTFTSLTSLACPPTETGVTCEVAGIGATTTSTTTSPVAAATVFRLDGDPAGLATSASWAPTAITADALPGTVTSVGSLACPTASLCEALAAGDATSATDPVVLTTAVAPSGASTWSQETTVPADAGSFSSISCTSGGCVVTGTDTSGSPAVWAADLTTTPNHTWTDETANLTSLVGASGFGSLPGASCGQPSGTDTADCVVATTPTDTNPAALMEGSLSGGTWAWNLVNLPSGTKVTSFLGVSCESGPSSSRSVCAAVGTGPAGAVVVATSGGPGGTWNDRTPTDVGTVPTGLPVELATGSPSAWTTAVNGGGASNTTSLSNLYPEPSGYSIAAADCAAGGVVAGASGSLTENPGGTADVNVPLGLLPLQVTGTGNSPVPGAKVTLTPETCPDSFSYTLPTTDSNGVTLSAVPYGTYSYTVTTSGTTTPQYQITVAPTSVTVTPLDNQGTPEPSLAVQAYLPGPAVVAAS